MQVFAYKMCNFLKKVFQCPRSEYVVDHLNGITSDNHVENLQWITRKENEKRAKLLRVLRSIGRDPRKMSRDELIQIFNKYTFTNPKNID